MSEDDVDALVADGQPSPQPGRDRRPPRFSWTPSFEATFFRSLCDSVQLGLRENNSFKAEAWERAAQVLQDCHGAFPAKSHLINKSDNARKRFRLWRGLREDPDFLYNASTRSVTATDEAWRRHIEASFGKEPISSFRLNPSDANLPLFPLSLSLSHTHTLSSSLIERASITCPSREAI